MGLLYAWQSVGTERHSMLPLRKGGKVSGGNLKNEPQCASQAGEIATLLRALAIAAEMILISSSAGKVNVQRVTVIQLAATSLLGFMMMLPNGESVPPFSPYLLYSALGLGMASALIQVTMNWAQRSGHEC